MNSVKDYIINFWLDYSISKYRKLEKYQDDPELSIILNVSFIQSININTLVFIFLILGGFHPASVMYMFYIAVIVFAINYFLNKKWNIIKNELLNNRIPKYGLVIYNLYGLISAALLIVLAGFFGN